MLNELDTANTEFTALIETNDINNSLSASQDIYYSGDLTKWQKLVNSFKLRVLVSLSNKTTVAELNIPGPFCSCTY